MIILNVKCSKVWKALLRGRTSLLQIDSQIDYSILSRSFTELYKDQKLIEDKGLPAPPRGLSEELQHSK